MLRDRLTDTACGALVLLRSDDPSGWHAHSALCSGEARLHFVLYLLFDLALDLCRDSPFWWDGQPSSAAGNGIWTFKSRFANDSAPVPLPSFDLDLDALSLIRAKEPLGPWLPDCRNPSRELSASGSVAGDVRR
jgi:hypothetical protein